MKEEVEGRKQSSTLARRVSSGRHREMRIDESSTVKQPASGVPPPTHSTAPSRWLSWPAWPGGPANAKAISSLALRASVKPSLTLRASSLLPRRRRRLVFGRRPAAIGWWQSRAHGSSARSLGRVELCRFAVGAHDQPAEIPLVEAVRHETDRAVAQGGVIAPLRP